MKPRMIFCAITVAFVLSGCAADTSHTPQVNTDLSLDDIVYLDDDEGTGIDLTAVDTGTLYMITSIDKKECVLGFSQVGSERSYQFRYDDETIFLNKYGDYMSVDDLRRGRIVNLGKTTSEAILTLVQISPEAWYRTKVTGVEVHDDEGYLLLKGKKYRIGGETRVFLKKKEISLSDISEYDTLAIQGQERTIYSIRVTKGHGTVAIYNTDLFVDGWMNLGSSLYTTITGDMTFLLPQGTYKLTVANNGYGDTKKIKVEAGKVTKVDLSEYEGEGPKKSLITFEINVYEAVVRLDGTEIDVSAPVEVVYGIHTLNVKAKGYEAWEHKMVVHSETATITIGDEDLTADGTEKGKPDEEADETETEAGESDETEETESENAETETAESPAEAEDDAEEDQSNPDDETVSASKSGGSSENTTDDAALETLKDLLKSLIEE